MTSGKTRLVQVVVLIVVILAALVTWLHMRHSVELGVLRAPTPPQQLIIPDAINIDCPSSAMLCGDKLPGVKEQSSNINVSKSIFHSLVTTLDFQCPLNQRFGRQGDGGYEACMSEAVAPKPRSCLVYSFGISNDWSFDEAFANFGCEVHSFDPSIGKVDHMHSPNVSFHNVGLWGSDLVDSHGWRLERLSTIRKRLGHEQRIIDVLKVDVEGAEWPFLRDLTFVDTKGLSKVKQMFIELHAPKFTPEPVTATDFSEISVYAKRLRENFGFQLYKNVQRNYCCGRFSAMMPAGVAEKCCHEVFYFNAHLIDV